VIKRIFDPFFSTQGKKVGTGLGLPITYGLIQEIGGILTVTSDTVKGTCFAIKLPVKMDKKRPTDAKLL
jgi:signal transduction histidine kinase